MDKILTSLKTYWFLVTAAFAVVGAFAQAQTKIQSLEEAVKSNSSTVAEVVLLKIQNERIDERTKALQESIARQERMLEALLTSSQRQTARQNKN